jgi:[ribosomal protein S18]-alanine N-acetyltransferase
VSASVTAKYTFRPLAVADLDAIWRIEQASFPDPWPKGVFYREMTSNATAHYIALLDSSGRVCGYAGFWLIVDEVQLTKIAIDPALRGFGLGEKLLVYCMEQSRQLGATQMTLEVRASNDQAKWLYQKQGFVSTGIRPKFYQIEPEDAMLMWVNLRE